MSTEALRAAARLWARLRIQGRPGAPDRALDGDVILAAQAKEVDGVVLTTNVRHLEGLVEVMAPPG